MSIAEHPTHHLGPSAAGELALGVPGAQDRWQPTRAGIVNSWAWAEEHLWFSNGWLALVGPNGSGKSLTASMLITVLLDADTSQTALSVSGKAAGTLTSRHTDWNDREDRTGIWWLEYGLRDTASGATEHMTTGLWLRATGGTLHRAFFIARGRVGTDLTLETDREPVRLEALASQLASCQGELFTDSRALRGQVTQLTLADERSYRKAIRSQLFAPLNEVQFEALLAVLRSLRSLRTAEGISPTRMRQVLTDALPALDTENLTLIAEAMERIAELEGKLERTRKEATLLQATDRNYRRYLKTLAQTEAARLTAANTEFDNQARRTREATDQLNTAETAHQDAERQRTQVQTDISQHKGRLAADELLLRDHAGADLPHKEQRARDLAAEAEAAATRAEEATGDAQTAEDKADSSRSDAQAAQQQLDRLTDGVRTSVTDLGAQAAFENLLAASKALTAARHAADAPLDTERLRSHPQAWSESRIRQIQDIEHALSGHQHAQGAERSASNERRGAETQEDSCRDEARETTARRQHAEEELATRLQAWQDTAPLLAPIPTGLTDPAQDSADRIDTACLTDWLTTAADAARARIDLPGHQQATATAAALAQAAARWAEGAHEGHTAAQAATAEAAAAHHLAEEQACADNQRDETHRTQAHVTHQQAEDDAQSEGEAIRRAVSGAEGAAVQAAREWALDVHAWRAGLTHLAATDIPLPDVSCPAAELAALQPAELDLSVARAHANAALSLQRRVDAAERKVQAAAVHVTEVRNQLEESRQAAPVPPPPPWRSRSPHDGVPLWALVDFTPSLSAGDADRLEGALLVAGLLDALITPDGALVSGDLTFASGEAAPGTTLADLLVVEASPTINAQRVHDILAAITVDTTEGDQSTTGRLAHGILIASAPAGYKASYIGRTARETARQQRVAILEGELAAAHSILAAAGDECDRHRQAIHDADDERDRVPTVAPLLEARAHAARQRQSADAAERRATQLMADARLTLHNTLAALDAAAATRTARLQVAEREHHHARQAQTRAEAAAAAAEAASTDRAAAARRGEEAYAQASAAQNAADTEQAAFPRDALETVDLAQQSEDAAERDMAQARADTIKATNRHQEASQAVSEALRTLNRAATLPDGTLLPTDPQRLRAHRNAATGLAGHIHAWDHAAHRVIDLLKRADDDQQDAETRRKRLTVARQEADRTLRSAQEEAATVAEMRTLYGTEYAELVMHREAAAQALQKAEERAVELQSVQQVADREAAAARAVLEAIAPQRETAEQSRDACLRRLGLLVDESLAEVPDDVPTDPAGRPANLTAGLTWARHLLTDAPGGTDRLTALTRQRDREMTTLETSARTASTALARFDRQVTLISIEDTPWRRAVVADPAAVRGEDVHLAVQALNATAAQLEDDLRADVKKTLKTSLFTRLQRDIQLRRQAAWDLVGKIRTTLDGVRTGVADVGVQVAWAVREDPDAQRMVDLIDQPPSDETFERMYDALRQRMNEKAGEPWPDRVAHTFDYRTWHEWKISVTHASFEAAGKEKFREVTPRSNPLEALSTGERRLATMLPLLAAAWSMYSTTGYRGPHLLSIDEIDAAFDDPNLRQVLALLRSWDFDVLATAPFMTPLIKKETQHAVIHQVVTTGRHRVTVPWLWQGHGEPQPLTLDLTPTRSPDAP
ncbi:SbcC/MukB-like Walker B domain-containing protein [Streptomyces sp. NPDC097617]|uniref:SbcC/MukB-like Walker B domain-containing protein n=1 Tax=Streptomyces sp. NPDC097617 TaxID=3366091 RepID=UPI0038195511